MGKPGTEAERAPAAATAPSSTAAGSPLDSLLKEKRLGERLRLATLLVTICCSELKKLIVDRSLGHWHVLKQANEFKQKPIVFNLTIILLKHIYNCIETNVNDYEGEPINALL